MTFSVSSSKSVSSRATASPGFLCHLATVASVTDSGKLGTLISMVMYGSYRIMNFVKYHPSSALQPQRLIHQQGLLLHMQLHITDGWRSGRRTSSVMQYLPFCQTSFHTLAQNHPYTLVFRFFLAPNHIVDVFILFQLRH